MFPTAAELGPRCENDRVGLLRVIRGRRGREEVAWPRPPRPPIPSGQILITGANGLVGGVLLEGLRRTHSVRGLDIRPGGRADLIVDMRRQEDAAAAFLGADTVIDLAANSRADASWEDVRANNLPATLNALEAARRAGVRRLIFASSNHVTGLAERDEPYTSIVAGRYKGLEPATLLRLRTDAPVRPDGPYGIAKAMGEAAGRFYAEEYGMSVICLRIGSFVREDRPVNTRNYATFLSHRDLLALVGACLSAPDGLRFGIYYGVSANRWRIWDIENAERELHYGPLDDAERWR
jgi:uronate dehydrogenase